MILLYHRGWKFFRLFVLPSYLNIKTIVFFAFFFINNKDDILISPIDYF